MDKNNNNMNMKITLNKENMKDFVKMLREYWMINSANKELNAHFESRYALFRSRLIRR